MRKMKEAFDRALMYNSETQEKRKRYYKINNFKEFDVGDLILLKDNYRVGKGYKLKLRWLGPYRIVDKYSPVNYTIEHIYDNHKRQVKVYINKLKECYLPDLNYDLLVGEQVDF